MKYCKSMTGKVLPEDSDLPLRLDPFLQTILDLWANGHSINLLASTKELRCYPPPTTELHERIGEYFEMLELWLPGFCDHCKHWVMMRTEVYWGSHPHYCPKCLIWAIEIFNEKEKWPRPNYFEDSLDEA